MDFTSRLESALREHERERAALEGSMSRYERGEELGRGGIAVVYRAWDRKLRRDVALKVLHAHLETAADARARFQREWQAAARLSHPNIVTVHDAGEDGGRMYLVMELVPGVPLSRILGERRVELRAMLEMLEKTARAVQYAHEQGVVHRDLKPSNILVPESRDPKVADFGLARLLLQEALVSTGSATVGTPVYMAPEQVCGGEITPRTDVYALGAVLYEMATGRPPQTGATVNEILSKVMHDDPLPPRRINGEISREIEIMALKALEKEPRRRYASALAFAEDLRRHLDHRPILAEPPTLWTRAIKRLRRRPAVSALAAALALGLVGAGSFAIVNRVRHDGNVARKRADAWRAESQGRLSDAAGLYSELHQLQPGDAEAAQKSVELPARAIEQGKQQRARELVDSALRLRQVDLPRVQEEVRALEARLETLRKEIPPYEGAGKKDPIWQGERKQEELRDELFRLRARVLDELTTAFSLHPAGERVRGAYLDECWRRMVEAEELGDREAASFWEERIRTVSSERHDSAWLTRLDAGGTLALDTVPSGAEAFLFRYEEGNDRRLLPRPYDLDRNESRTPEVEAAPETACSEFNRLDACPLAIPRGSYLIVLRTPGKRDTRFPLCVGRGTRHEAKVNLYADEEIGAGFVYVPAGKFVMGGDPKADNAAPRDPDAETGDFFIGKFEVTSEDYLRFLQDRTHHTLREAIYKMPRETEDTGTYWTVRDQQIVFPEGWDGRAPCIGVSWDNAKDYCDWMTKRARERGEKVSYRLATYAEWEKAARGVDARVYPWGNHFDDSFTLGGRSKPLASNLDIGGAFVKDESPYGVRDMAGSVREFCGEAWDSGGMFLRGGYWQLTGERAFRVAGRWAGRGAGTAHGFRLVRVLEK